MKLFIKSSLLYFLLLSLVSGCNSTSNESKNQLTCNLPASAPSPDWINNPVAQDHDYLFGYGVVESKGKSLSKARELARAEARRELAESLSTQVTSEVIVNSKKISSDKITQVNTEMQANLITRSELLLSKAMVEQYFSESTNCYMWAKIKLSKSEWEQQKQQLTATAQTELTTVLSKIEKNTSALLTNAKQQNEKLDVIVKSTKRTAIEELLMVYGVSQFNTVGFIEAAFKLPEQQFDEAMKLFKLAEFDINLPVSNYPDCMGQSTILGPQDALRNKQTIFFYISNNLTVASCLIAMGLESQRIEKMLDIFDFNSDNKTNASKLYMSNWLNNIFSLPRGSVAGPNPAQLFNVTESFNLSLISFMKPNSAPENLNRGEYTLMHIAAIFNRSELIEPLLKRGFDSQEKSISGYTPLGLAIEHNSYKFIDKAIKSGFHKNDNEGQAFTLSLIKAFSYSAEYFHMRNSSQEGIVIYNPEDNPMFHLAKKVIPTNKSLKRKRAAQAIKAYKVAKKSKFSDFIPIKMRKYSANITDWVIKEQERLDRVNNYINYVKDI